MRFHAENTYASWCISNGGHPRVERVRENLRTSLDEVAEYLSTFRPDDWKERQRFWTAKKIVEAEEEYAVEWAEAEEDEDVVVEEEENEEERNVAADGENAENRAARDEEDEVEVEANAARDTNRRC
jgi:hypothetical protein